MLIPNQKVKVKWGASNKKHYTELGYKFTKLGDTFLVNPEEIPHGSRARVGFICDICKKEFYPTLKSYFRNSHSTLGEYKCLKCYTQNINVFNQEARTEYIYGKIQYICHKYGYTLLTDKSDIKNVESKIDYICPKHGLQSRRALLFTSGEHICPECNRDNKRLSVEYVSKVIRDKGSILINPEDYQGSQISNLKIMCSNCGEIFITSYNSFICTRDKEGQICPNCIKNRSRGEVKIINYLKSKGIDYVLQKTFEDCRDLNELLFDFYIPKYNLIIEFDGKQHFVPTSFNNTISADENYKYIKKHDMMKNLYCFSNHINLIRIPYYDYKKIEEKLDNYFNSHEDIV